MLEPVLTTTPKHARNNWPSASRGPHARTGRPAVENGTQYRKMDARFAKFANPRQVAKGAISQLTFQRVGKTPTLELIPWAPKHIKWSFWASLHDQGACDILDAGGVARAGMARGTAHLVNGFNRYGVRPKLGSALDEDVCVRGVVPCSTWFAFFK